MAAAGDPMRRLANAVADLFCRPGSPFYDDRDLHAMQIEWVIRLGQFAMIADPESDRLLGFIGWWRLNHRALQLLHDQGAEALVRSETLHRIDGGPHAYVSVAVVAPWAPRSTYIALRSLFKSANLDADTWSTEFMAKNGRRTWRLAPLPSTPLP